MSLANDQEPVGSSFSWISSVIAFVVMAGLVAGCQVRPLYGSGGTLSSTATGEVTPLSSISVKAVSSRPAQIVRNQLVFLLNGGAEEKTATRYSVTLTVTSSTASAAYVQVTSEDEPTAGTVTMRARYEITDTQSGKVIHRGNRQAVASYDVSRQRFAAQRAERDAQLRAGREVAELVRLSIAQDLSQPTGFGNSSTLSAPIEEVTPAPGDQTRGQVAN